MAQMVRWTARQEKILRDLYPGWPRYQIEVALAPHSWSAIRNHANRLGLHRHVRRDWVKIAREHRPVFRLTG